MIWVIDDDAYMLKLLGYKIQKLGHDVLLFSSAEDALLKELSPDLTHIFTDIHLNGKSGFELAEIMKTKTDSASIIALTGSDLSDNERAKSLFDHIFRKPLSDDDLDSVFKIEFDFPYLNAMIESEEDKIDIIRHFHEETTRDSAELTASMKECDHEKMLLLSHRLSGRLAQFSQESISAGFRYAETQLLEGNTNVSVDLGNTLEKLKTFLLKLEKI